MPADHIVKIKESRKRQISRSCQGAEKIVKNDIDGHINCSSIFGVVPKALEKK